MIGMRNLIVSIVLVLSGCSLYAGDDAAIELDAGVTPDAAECEPTLPTCGSRGCTPDSQYLDCPRSEDTSVCYCDVPPDVPTTHPLEAGWCRNQ